MKSTTPADCRAMIARSRQPLYIVAAKIGLHPAHLGRVLNERVPLSDELAQRIINATGLIEVK